MSVKGKFLKRVSTVTVFRDKPSGASTTISAAAKGATTVTVASATGVTAGKSFRIGTHEDIERIEVASITGTTVTLATKLLRDHAASDPCVEQQGYAIDGITGGVTTEHVKETADDSSGMQRLVYAKLEGYQSFGVSLALKGYTIPNLCFALGIPLTRIYGTGASIANVLSLATDLNDTDSESNTCLVASYVRHDGVVITEEFWGCAVDFTALSLQLAFGQSGAIPVKFIVCGAGVQQEGAMTYALHSNTYRASKGKTFGHLTSVGLFLDGGAGSTVATAAAADTDTIVLASASAFTAGSWAAVIGTNGTELHWIHSIASETLTLKTRTLRAHAVGVSVIPVTQLAFGSITKEGITFSVGGATTPIQIGTRDLAIGMQADEAEASVSLRLQEITNAARAYLSGIPQTEISSDSRLLLTDKLNTQTSVLGVYVTGVLKDGTVNMLNLWGTVQDLSDLGAEMLTATSTSRSFKAEPTSGIQLVQYAG